MSKFIPLSIPNFEGNEKKYADDAQKIGTAQFIIWRTATAKKETESKL